MSETQIAADPQTPQATDLQTDTTHLMTSMAAGKAIATKRKQAREVQEKALAEASVIIANNHAESSDTETSPQTETKNIFTTTQWLCHQHWRFTCLDLLQTQRDPQLSPSKDPSAFTCGHSAAPCGR